MRVTQAEVRKFKRNMAVRSTRWLEAVVVAVVSHTTAHVSLLTRVHWSRRLLGAGASTKRRRRSGSSPCTRRSGSASWLCGKQSKRRWCGARWSSGLPRQRGRV